MTKADITAYISTKDRYDTTLPLAINSIIHQTVLPKKFILFEDSEPVDIRSHSVYMHLLRLLEYKGIEWAVYFGKKKGQVHNHQMAVNICDTEWLWRVDDDNIAEPNVLEGLLQGVDDKTGAIGGLVIDPTQIMSIDDASICNKIEKIYDQPNAQWYKNSRKDIFPVEHLYSSFLYRKSASDHGYCVNLSCVGHREETMFSHEMYRNGWTLKVNPNVITWHLRAPQGGIRSYSDKGLWDHDEKIFQRRMNLWKSCEKDENMYIMLNCGIGDTYCFKNLLPELQAKYGDKLVLSVCYPEVFHDCQVKLISIQDGLEMVNDGEKYNLYKWCTDNKWTGTLLDAFKKMYL